MNEVTDFIPAIAGLIGFTIGWWIAGKVRERRWKKVLDQQPQRKARQ